MSGKQNTGTVARRKRKVEPRWKLTPPVLSVRYLLPSRPKLGSAYYRFDGNQIFLAVFTGFETTTQNGGPGRSAIHAGRFPLVHLQPKSGRFSSYEHKEDKRTVFGGARNECGCLSEQAAVRLNPNANPFPFSFLSTPTNPRLTMFLQML